MTEQGHSGHDAPEDAVGRTRTAEDHVSLARAQRLAMTLEEDVTLTEGAPIPLGWHWIFAQDAPPRARLGADGHEARGSFLPFVPDARRMWAGGRIAFHGSLVIGGTVTRTSRIRSVAEKSGRQGALVFVTVEHLFTDDSGLLVEEAQDLVYVRADPGGTGRPRTSERAQGQGEGSFSADWSIAFETDEVMLFRFSALTFNGHRIHYDHPYATRVEGYPGLVVHGPLIALKLLSAGLARTGVRALGRGEAAIPVFRYRARAPAFCGERIDLLGAAPTEVDGRRSVALRASHPQRGLLMEATLGLNPSPS